jgi:hypothetical protein
MCAVNTRLSPGWKTPYITIHRRKRIASRTVDFCRNIHMYFRQRKSSGSKPTPTIAMPRERGV